MDFGRKFDQTREDSRLDYCFNQIVLNVPFVYGYVIANKMYSKEKYELALNTTERVLVDGVASLMLEVDWLDDYSLENSLKKVNYMDLYVGVPPNLQNPAIINEYYKDLESLNMSNGFIKNYDIVLQSNINHKLKLFNGEEVNLHEPWPSTFGVPEQTSSWLGVNAFYSHIKQDNEKGNYFVMYVYLYSTCNMQTSRIYRQKYL